jgi:acetyl esterase/lipase
MVLEYAASDNTMCLNDPTQSRSRAFSLYYADGDVELLKDPYLSPVNASDQQLRGLPRTLFIAPKQCPFYEVNQDLARRMSDLGVEVTVHSYEARHAFIVRRLDDWRGAQEDVLRALRAASL